MEPAFFYLIEERITPHLRKSVTNFRKPLEVGLKLAVTLRHLSTGESFTSLEYHWRIGQTTICKFVPQVCQAILKEYLVCPTDPEDWEKIEERFRNTWNVPHAVGALDGKHIASKKPKKSGSEYFNYKGYLGSTLGLPPPEPLGPNLHYLLLGDDAFPLMPWLAKPYSRRQLTR